MSAQFGRKGLAEQVVIPCSARTGQSLGKRRTFSPAHIGREHVVCREGKFDTRDCVATIVQANLVRGVMTGNIPVNHTRCGRRLRIMNRAIVVLMAAVLAALAWGVA